MKTTRSARTAVLTLAVAATCMAAEQGYSKYSRQRELAREGEQAENVGLYGDAAKAYRKSRLYAVDNRTRAQLLLREAECRVQQGAPYKAFEAYKTLLESYPLHIPYDRVMPRLRQLAADFEQGAGSWFGFRNRNQAIEVYQLILQEAPVGSGVIQDSLNLGGLLTAADRPQEAISAYREALKRFPAAPLAPDVHLELGRLLVEDSRTGDGDGQVARQAVRELNAFIAAKPDDPRRADAEFLLALLDERRAEAKYNLSRFYLRPVHRRELAARRYLADVVRDYPKSTAAARATQLQAALGPAPATLEFPPFEIPPKAVAEVAAPAAAAPEVAATAAPQAKAKQPARRLFQGLLPGGRADEGQPRTFRTLKERENVKKWLLPLGDVNELKAGGGSQ
jgi:tetratricopeptide (TPR) repeat protein